MPSVDYARAFPLWVDPNYTRNRLFYDCNPNFAIVIHKTAGFSNVDDLGNYFAYTPLVTSSHYGVGQDGSVAQYVQESDGAAANCCLVGAYDPFWNDAPTANKNLCTISIEHIDPASDNSTPVTDAQKQASFHLVLDICKRHNIPVSHIKTHGSIDPVNRARCPGNYPMQELIDFVQKGLAPHSSGPNAYMEQAAHDEWNSFFSQIKRWVPGATLPPFDTGIASSWKNRLFTQDQHIGPPVTYEYQTVDWNGKPIVAQNFTDGRAEWDNGTCTWYSTNGSF